ncbi:MAG: thioredoxin family protein [Paracoccaceae bacterium]
MKRRDFIVLSAAAAAMPLLAHALGATYAPGLVRSELAAGKTVFVDFNAKWCPTCAAQGRVIAKHQASNPAYEENISFIDVDWDNYGNGELSRALNIPRRSTLVVLKGDQELGRIVAGTSKKVIKKLMDIALNAAIA